MSPRSTLLAVSALAIPGCQAGTCPGVDESDWILVSAQWDRIWQVDPDTAAMTELSQITTERRPTSTDVLDGRSFMYDDYGDTLAEFDACTGETSTIGPSGIGHAGGIAFGDDGRLFGLDNDADTLVEFDLETGAASTIGELGLDVGRCGMAYDCSSDTLWAVDADANLLFAIDTETGDATDFTKTDLPFDYVGLEWWIEEERLIASTGEVLYSIDPRSGRTDRIGSLLQANNINDLAFHPPCDG